MVAGVEAEVPELERITVPPPDDGDDAYSAPTRIGPLSASQVADLMNDAGADEESEGVQSGVRPVRAPAAAAPAVVREEPRFEPCIVPPPPASASLRPRPSTTSGTAAVVAIAASIVVGIGAQLYFVLR